MIASSKERGGKAVTVQGFECFSYMSTIIRAIILSNTAHDFYVSSLTKEMVVIIRKFLSAFLLLIEIEYHI